MAAFLHVYRRYWPDEGGIESVVRSVCERAAGLGHEVTTLTCSRYPWTRSETHCGVRIIRCATVGTLANTPFSPPMTAWVRRLRPDLVEVHHPYPFGLWSVLRSRFDGPLVLHYHMDISRFRRLQALVRPTLERALARADRIIASSHRYAETSPVLRPWLEKCVFIPPSVDPARLRLPDSGQERLARQAGGGPCRVLFVGRLTPYKGLPDLLRAMQWVDGELTIVGRGELAGRLHRLAADLGVANRVRFLGRVPDEELVHQYHAADLVVLPSSGRGEAFGIVQVEAMLCGKPVICSDLPGVAEVGQEGETCCVFPRGDSRALADRINELAADPARRERMGQAGRQRALALYTPQRLLARHMAVYEELLGRPLIGEANHGTA